MGLPLSMIDRLRSYGVPDEDIEFLNEGWSKPVPSVYKTSTKASQRQARWREKKRLQTVDKPSTGDVYTGGTIGGEVISFEEKKVKIKTPPSPSQPDPVTELFDAYNVCAEELGWDKAAKLNRKRRASLKRAIDDAGGLEQAFDHLNDLANSKFGREWGAGGNDREWRINLDYVFRPSVWLPIVEGKYNGIQTQGHGTNGSTPATGGYG